MSLFFNLSEQYNRKTKKLLYKLAERVFNSLAGLAGL